MSAYGAVTLTNRPVDLLPPTTWDLPQPAPGKPAAPFRRLVLHHLRLESARALPAAGPSLLEYTHRIFAAEVEAGRTYPQEAVAAGSSPSGKESDDLSGSGGDTHTHTHAHAAQAAYTRTAFEAYFWAADVIVAIGQTDDEAADGGNDDGQVRAGSGDLLEISRGGRSGWEGALVGFYYVKPNYPGRSSHVSEFLSTIFVPSPILFYTRRSLTHDGLGRFAMQVLLSPLPTGNSDMERLWARRTCIMVLH
jgi:hypothetical protein